MKSKIVIGIIGVLLLCGLCIGSVSASYSGYTYEQSTYQYGSPEWVQDIINNVYPIITASGVSLDDRLKNQAYALGWKDQFDIVDQYGMIDYDTGVITYDLPWNYDTSAFFGSVPSRETLYTTVEEYENDMNNYYNVFSLCVQSVPREV